MAIVTKPQKHLLNILKTTNNPNFTLFLGAGSSVTSGVKNATTLINQWRTTYSEMYPELDIKDEYWYDQPTEYSVLFERLYDQPSQRREFIENCVKDALPSWGYIYLANLLKENIFNTVFTTNFDDLINEACYSFSTNLKPLVSAHDSSISSVRITSPRPKIIKLHGDFLFDDIKNTVRELESLEDNMRSKFKQYASEFGMIVVGYSGNDRSIMETLNTLLRNDSNFPHGIYWCVRKDTDLTKLSKDLEELTRFPRFHLITIDGFDELLADVHHCLQLKMQDEVSNPYKHLAERLDNFVSLNDSGEGEEHEHAAINTDIQVLKNNIQRIHHAIEMVDKVEQVLKADQTDTQKVSQMLQELGSELQTIKNGVTDEVHLIATPNALMADIELGEENYEKAIGLSLKALESRITVQALSTLVLGLCKNGESKRFIETHKYFGQLESISDKEAKKLISTVVELIDENFLEEALFILSFLSSMKVSLRIKTFLNLNEALILRLQEKDIPEELLQLVQHDLDRMVESKDSWLTFGLSLILSNDDRAYKAAQSLSTNQILVVINRDQPIMRLISEDLYAMLLTLPQVEAMLDDEELDETSDNVTTSLTEDNATDIKVQPNDGDNTDSKDEVNCSV
ncbi:SIR2 family protein [Vibrio lentus]